MNVLLEKFRLHNEKEDFDNVISSIETGVVFRGTNLWVLIFAIFVASLGLNVNSPAVIIGAMLISPLMGPIMGIGLALGINDLSLLKKAAINFLIAVIVALITSTLFFSISPLNDAHSEILARTTPNIYDVLIAFFGGMAGIVATSSKNKGNVITGVAIATALMPPLCTAGYGLATQQFSFFLGAFYLFIINTVFIALATLLMVRILQFPLKEQTTAKQTKVVRNYISIITILTLIPSIYFGYTLIQENKFEKQANIFIQKEAHFPNDYLLNKKIDAKTKHITLVFGGKKISDAEIAALQQKLADYQLTKTILEVKQGFTNDIEGTKTAIIEADDILHKQAMNDWLTQKDSTDKAQLLHQQVFKELKIQHPTISSFSFYPAKWYADSASIKEKAVAIVVFKELPTDATIATIKNWLQIRLQNNSLLLITTDNKQLD